MTRSARVTPCLGRRCLVVLAPGEARARQSYAGVALAAGGSDSDMGTAAAYGNPTPYNERLRCTPGNNLTRR